MAKTDFMQKFYDLNEKHTRELERLFLLKKFREDDDEFEIEGWAEGGGLGEELFKDMTTPFYDSHPELMERQENDESSPLIEELIKRGSEYERKVEKLVGKRLEELKKKHGKQFQPSGQFNLWDIDLMREWLRIYDEALHTIAMPFMEKLVEKHLRKRRQR